ncbi:GTPase [uncultured Thiothrix sp.]|uniref:GTPase n=1 Tax=uncultured Thiothrix sp. TaxID=223185 RepID=UPI002623D34B|nr:GTPase [uncultured Thiothrix sp.]
MKISKNLRWILAGAIVFGTFMFLLFLFYATQSALNLWDRLQQLPSGLFYLYVGLIALVLLGGLGLALKLVLGSNRVTPNFQRPATPATIEQVEAEIKQIEAAGMDITPFREELERLNARKETGQINIAFFGDVSTGKSSIIKTLLPSAGVEISLRGGSTREIHEYMWQTSSGDRLLLTDLPGRNEAEGFLDELARDEAVRAQIVVYVVDSDLSRSQFEDIQELYTFGKPLIIAFNKSDLYTPEEKQQLKERIQSRFGLGTSKELLPKVVFIQSGGVEEVVRVYPDGREETLQRQRKADVNALSETLQTEIDSRIEWLEKLRDSSVFSLVQTKLDESRASFRREQAEKIVRNGTRNAVIGALAAISPGTDIIIQGVIGTRMIQELCKLYDVPVKQIDIDQFLDFSQNQMKKSIPLILAVAGNGLKAFPGIGTVAGGLVHAVAYGLIFDALGHAVTLTLEQRGALKAAPAALTFREMLSGNLEERTKTLARLVVDQYKTKDSERISSEQ